MAAFHLCYLCRELLFFPYRKCYGPRTALAEKRGGQARVHKRMPGVRSLNRNDTPPVASTCTCSRTVSASFSYTNQIMFYIPPRAWCWFGTWIHPSRRRLSASRGWKPIIYQTKVFWQQQQSLQASRHRENGPARTSPCPPVYFRCKMCSRLIEHETVD